MFREKFRVWGEGEYLLFNIEMEGERLSCPQTKCEGSALSFDASSGKRILSVDRLL